MAEEMFRSVDDLPEADRHVLTAIRKTLWNYEPLRATRPTLDIGVRDGRVELTGRVRTLAIKEIAEYMLLRVPGVRAVRNDLIADPEVTRAVADAIAADGELGPLCPFVDSRDGMVTLAGNVPTDQAARRLVELATNVPLVASVTSFLQVQPTASTMPTNGMVAHAASANGSSPVADATEQTEA